MSVFNNIDLLDWTHGVINSCDFKECTFRATTSDQQDKRFYFTAVVHRNYMHNHSHLPDESCYSVSLQVSSAANGTQQMPFPVHGSRLWYFFVNKAKKAFTK